MEIAAREYHGLAKPVTGHGYGSRGYGQGSDFPTRAKPVPVPRVPAGFPTFATTGTLRVCDKVQVLLPVSISFKFPRHPSDPTRRLVAIDSLATSPIPIRPPSTHNVYHFSLSRSYTLTTSFQICINSNEVTGRFVVAVVVVVVVAVVVAVVVVTASSRDRLEIDSRCRGRRCAVVAQPTRAVVAVVAQLSCNRLAPSLRPRRATDSRRRCALVAQPTRAVVAPSSRNRLAPSSRGYAVVVRLTRAPSSGHRRAVVTLRHSWTGHAFLRSTLMLSPFSITVPATATTTHLQPCKWLMGHLFQGIAWSLHDDGGGDNNNAGDVRQSSDNTGDSDEATNGNEVITTDGATTRRRRRQGHHIEGDEDTRYRARR
ncbi:hypothetical protein EDB84DRAFT_1442883 [Lactarius hengduanensis]|nr:hypothetical protein EDB84DRAFT_1442883 [Lactarius hengduanensis]